MHNSSWILHNFFDRAQVQDLESARQELFQLLVFRNRVILCSPHQTWTPNSPACLSAGDNLLERWEMFTY